METLIQDIQSRLHDLLGDRLAMIDEDYGQLQMMFEDGDDKDTYPVVSPALTVNVREVSWQCLAGTVQTGVATVVVTLAIDCYDDTHIQGSPDHHQRERIAERLALMNDIHHALQGYRPSSATPLNRVSTRLYHLPRLWKAYEITYQTTITDAGTEPEPRSLPLSPVVRTRIERPSFNEVY